MHICYRDPKVPKIKSEKIQYLVSFYLLKFYFGSLQGCMRSKLIVW